MRFNIIEFIENVIEMQQDKAEDQGIELTYEYNGIESDEMVTTDSGRLT
jgi:signal transduction histidine kinase